MRFMKKSMKWLAIRLLGMEITHLLVRNLSYIQKYRTGYFGAHGIDRKLEALLPHRNGFYVELGANDGALASNSYFFELKKGWSGLLVEPAPNLFLSLLKRRGQRNFVAAFACVPFDYPEDFVKMSYSDSMTISTNLDIDIGDQKKFLEAGEKHLPFGEKNFEFGAKSSTLNALLVQANAPTTIDFLSLDVEGAELAVLQGVDFGMFTFKFMVIESRKIDRIEIFLAPLGYELVEKITHHDYLFAPRSKN